MRKAACLLKNFTLTPPLLSSGLEGTPYHNEGLRMMEVANKYITFGRQGVEDFRGRTPGVTRAFTKVMRVVEVMCFVYAVR